MQKEFLENVRKRLYTTIYNENKCWTNDVSKIFAKS